MPEGIILIWSHARKGWVADDEETITSDWRDAGMYSAPEAARAFVDGGLLAHVGPHIGFVELLDDEQKMDDIQTRLQEGYLGGANSS
jgi:hypothetical protein